MNNRKVGRVQMALAQRAAATTQRQH